MVQRAITNIKNVLVQQQSEIMTVAGMLLVVGLITKVFGLAFTAISVRYLGADALDSFLFAGTVPELISQIVLFGAISASVLPVLAKAQEEKGEYRFLRVFNTLVNLSLIVFTLIALFLALTAEVSMPWLLQNIIRPRNEISPEQIPELVSMLRWLLVPQVVLGVSAFMSTALNLHERFLVPQLAPLFYNLGRILAIFLLIPILGQTPWVLVWGTLIGAALHLLIQLPLLRHLNIRFLPVLDLRDYYVRRIGTIAGPRVLSISVEQIAQAADKFIAFGLIGNSLSLYQLAISLVSIPLSLIGSSFATASFPSIAKALNKNNRILATEIFLKVLNQILFFSIPAAILLLVLRVPIARLTYGVVGGGINFLQTYTVAWVILFFAPGLILETLRTFLYRTFYAAHDTVRPLFMSMLVLVGGVVTGVLFTNYFSHFNSFDLQALTFNPEFFLTRADGVAAVAGLALSSTLVFSVESFLLIIWLNRTYLRASWFSLFWPIFKKLLAGLVMLAALYWIYKIWAGLESTEKTIYLVILTFTTTAAALMIYVGMSAALAIDEVSIYVRFLVKYPNRRFLRSLFGRFLRFNPIPKDITT